MRLRSFFLLWWVVSVLVISTAKAWLNPSDFAGALLITVIGTLIAGLLAWCSVLIWSALHRRRELIANFSSHDLETAARVGFREAISKSLQVLEGHSSVVFGVSPRSQIRLLSFDVRPVEKDWLGRWISLSEPRAISFTKLRVLQLQWARQGLSEHAYNSWHNDHGGFI